MSSPVHPSSKKKGIVKAQSWRHKLGQASDRRVERTKNMGHYPPGQRHRAGREILMNIYGKLKLLTEGTGCRTPAANGPGRSGEGGGDQHSAPLQTLIIGTDYEHQKLDEKDKVTELYQCLDADFVRGDWLARIFYGCLSDDADYELRECVWRYTQLEFLLRMALAADEHCYRMRHKDERVCCGILEPRTRLYLEQYLMPENWNRAYGCPYRSWDEFLEDYNAWGRGEAGAPRWFPKSPPTAKKAAEDIVVIYLICRLSPCFAWYFGKTKDGAPSPPHTDLALSEQFLLRGNDAQTVEAAVVQVMRCVEARHDHQERFYEVALQLWPQLGAFLPKNIELQQRREDLRDATSWTGMQWPEEH